MLEFRRLNRQDSAFAATITYLAARDPFRTMPIGPLAVTVSGAVKRGHYILAIEDGRVIGLTCWALTTASMAERWMAGEVTPSFEDCLGGNSEGDTVVMTLGGGENSHAALLGVRHIAGLYPGRPYWMNRVGRVRKSRGRFPARAARTT